MIRPEIARYMLRNRGRNAALQQGGLARLTHDSLAELGVTPRPLEDEGPEETAAEGGVEEPVVPVAIAEKPQGQVLARPQEDDLTPEELDAFPQPFTAPPMTQAAPVPVPAQGVEPGTDDADELANARANDRTAAIARGFETAGRQLVAGISRTPILDTLTQQTNQAGEVRAAQKAREESRATKLRQAAEMARQSRLDDSTIATGEADRIEKLARAAALSREKRTGQDPSLTARGLDLREKQIATDAEAKAAKQALEEKKFAASQVPKPAKGPAPVRGIPEGYEENPNALPSEDGKKKFTELVMTDAGMRGLTGKMRKVLSEVSARGRFVPGENAALSQLAQQIALTARTMAKLGVINGPDVGIMDRLSGDPTSVFSLARDTGALLDGLDSWGGNEVTAGQKAYGIRPKGGGSTGGKVRMTNGRETLDVDAGDVADAAKEGFKRVQ